MATALRRRHGYPEAPVTALVDGLAESAAHLIDAARSGQAGKAWRQSRGPPVDLTTGVWREAREKLTPHGEPLPQSHEHWLPAR